MKPNTWLLLLAVMAMAGQACNLPQATNTPQPTSRTENVPTATATPTQPPAPIATVAAEARVEAGDVAYFNGDWDAALDEYQRVVNESDEEELRAAGLLGVGRTQIKLGNLVEARRVLQGLVEEYPSSQAAASA